MIMRTAPLHLTLFLATLFLATSAFAALPLPPEKEQWLTLNAAEFHIYSNAGERETKRVANDLLRMREAIGKVTRLNVRSTKPTHIFLFRNERSFAPFRDALFQQRNANVSGGFITDGRANFIIMQADAESGVARVVYHELTHHFVRNTLDGLPLWFQEGIAEYYSTFGATEQNVHIGRPVREYIAALRGGQVMPLAKLFAVKEDSPEYRENDRQSVFYGQSWGFIHYFFAGNPQRRAQLPQFLDLVGQGTAAEEAFRTAFGASYADIEKELRTYFNKPTLPYVTYSLDELKIPAIDSPKPVSRDELLTRLGQLLATSTPTLPDSLPFLQEAIRINPKNAESYAALGIAHERRNDDAAAAAAFDKAVSFGSSEPFVYLASGAAILNRIADSGADAPPHDQLLRARRLFQRAAELDPQSAHGWAGVGATYVGSGEDAAPGVAALEKSLALDPAHEGALTNLVQLYATNKRLADAQRLFDSTLARSKNADLVQRGREALIMGRVHEAEEMIAAGRHVEGVALMREVLGKTTNPRLREHLQTALAAYDQHMATEQHVQAIEAALAKANAGKYGEALKMIDELLPKITDAEMKKNVQELRGELAAAAKKKK